MPVGNGLKALFGVSLYRNAIFLIAANLANSLLGFVFWIAAARFYTPEEVGLGSAVISATQLLTGLAGLGLGFGLVRFLPGSPREARRMINTLLAVSALMSVLAAGVFLAGLGVWSPELVFVRQSALYAALFVVFTAVFTCSGLLDNAFIARRHSGAVVVRSLIFGVLKTVIAIGLAAPLAAFGILSSWGIAAFIAVAVSLVWLLPAALRGARNPAFPHKEGEGITDAASPQNEGEGAPGVREFGRFSVGNWVGALLWAAPGQVLALMVVHQLGAAANAHFYVAFTIAGILFAVPAMASTSLFAEGSSDERLLRQHVRRSLKLTFAILVPGVVVVLLGAGYLLWPFGRAYAEAADLLRLMALASLPMALNVTFIGVKRVEKKVGAVVLVSGLTAALTLVLSWMLLPRLGINGAGVAWLVGQGITLPCTHRQGRLGSHHNKDGIVEV